MKGVPDAREGYEQRLVVHRKYKDALAKGWIARTDIRYSDNDFILCERLISREVNLLCEPTETLNVLTIASDEVAIKPSKKKQPIPA